MGTLRNYSFIEGEYGLEELTPLGEIALNVYETVNELRDLRSPKERDSIMVHFLETLKHVHEICLIEEEIDKQIGK